MIEFIREIFEYRFLAHAALGCLLAGVVCGIVGTWVVYRRLVFLSGGITHASFGGIGLAWYLGLDPIAGAGVFAVLSALGLEALSQRMKIREDSAVGILWSVGMALGVLFVFLTPGYAPNLMTFLFGNLLTITSADLVVLAIVAAVLLLIFTFFYRPILYVAFDREYARAQGVPVGWIGGGMMVLTALTIVLCIRLVGIVLLISLITLPATIAGSLSRSYRKTMVGACAIATLGAFTGLYVSYRTDIPSGASIILVLALTLAVVKTAVYFVKKR